MVTPDENRNWIWRCLNCHGALTSDTRGLQCAGCGKQYPIAAGVTILVSDPASYLRSEIASVDRTLRDAAQRNDTLDRLGREAGLPNASLDRHRDVLRTDIVRAEMLRDLVEPAAKILETTPGSTAETEDAKRLGLASGWAADSLLPYLLRDWTNTSELEAASSMISTALKHAFPDPSGKSVVFAGCGAGGLLAEMPPDFERVFGFDLTFPVLAAARRLLDGETIDLALPRSVSELGVIRLSKRDPASPTSHVEVFAMDALNTAFGDGSIDCVITCFLTDLMPDPYRLADEIRRILSPNGIWINYGPSGPLKSVWRFDKTESAAFFESAGFEVIESEAHRTTNLDLSGHFPTWAYRSLICYLTASQKSQKMGAAKRKPTRAIPTSAELAEIIPQHFPGAQLVERHSLGAERSRKALLRHERIPGRMESFELSNDAARMMTLVDGKKTVRDIAELFEETGPAQGGEKTIGTFGRYFTEGLLGWRKPTG